MASGTQEQILSKLGDTPSGRGAPSLTAPSRPISPVVIVGAGPYGLSLAAHLNKVGIPFRIFGRPMESWSEHMPKGMHLKSEGFASNLFDPDRRFTLRRYCVEKGLPYEDIGLPIPIETFAAYGIEFQKRLVPQLEAANISSLRLAPGGFELETENGERLRAANVVLAIGITHFAYIPPELAHLPREFVTHTSDHENPAALRGKSVAVVGAGASAVSLASLLHAAGVEIHLIARAKRIEFHERSQEPRPLFERIRNPRSGLGVGWRSWLCTDAPLLFHRMPRKFRFRVVRRHLGPAPGWFEREGFVGKVPVHLGKTIESAALVDNRVELQLAGADGSHETVSFDHVISGCGYRVSLARLSFLNPDLRKQLRSVEDTPVLNNRFETSIPGLYMTGLASANCFGPMFRFALGAGFAAERLSRHFAHKITR